MAHMAQLKDGVVSQVIVINNEVLLDETNTEQESIGIAFCKSLYGENTEWVQTSYNNNFRGKFASIGDIWDGTNFVKPETQSDGS